MYSVTNNVLLPHKYEHQMQLSYWERKDFMTGFDTIIIGAGIVGISAALSLMEADSSRRILILERGFLPSGASTKNAGFACFGSPSELLDDFEGMGRDATIKLVAKRYAGLAALRKRTGDESISFIPGGNYEVFREQDEALFEHCREMIPELNRLTAAVTGVSDTYRVEDNKIAGFGFREVSHLILNRCEGRIDTGKMMKKLMQLAQSAGIGFCFGAEVRKIEDEESKVVLRLQSDYWIETKQIIVATNGFAKRLLPELKVQPARNQVLITHPYKNLKLNSCYHYDRGYFYWREIDGRVLLGGGRNLFPETEFTDLTEINSHIQHHLTEMLKSWITPYEFPGIDMQWSGILGVGNVKYPILRKLSANVTVAVRMGGMGVALGTLAGEEAAKIVLGTADAGATEAVS